MLGVWTGPWRLLERVSPGACLFWCALVQRRGFETATECGGGRSWLLSCRMDAVVGHARGKLHMVEGTWVLTM
jgi:hypothetical protein